MSTRIGNFFEHEAQFRRLLEQKTLSYSEEVNPLVSSYFKTMKQVSTVSPDRAGEAVRSIFTLSQAVFFKFQHSLSVHDQEGFILFVTSIFPLTPNLSSTITNGLEDTVIKVCEVALQLTEEQHKIVDAKVFPEFLSMLRSLIASLELVNVRAAPLLKTIKVFNRCTTLVVRNIAGCDESSFGFICDALNKSLKKICEIRGGSRAVLSHLQGLFAGLVGAEAVTFSSHVPVQRLFEMTLAYVRAIFFSCPYLTPEEAESVHGILDSLDRVLADFLHRCPKTEHRDKILGLRKDLHEGLCGIYQTIMIERYERQGQPLDPSFVFPPLDVLKRSCVGLHSSRVDSVPREHLITQYTQTLAFAVRHCDEIPRSEFEKIVIVFAKVRKKWPSDQEFIAQWSHVRREVAEHIRQLPSISLNGFQNLIVLVTGEISGIKLNNEHINLEASEAFFQIIDAIDSLIPRCKVRANQRKEPFELRTTIVTGVCDIRPTFAIEWFDRSRTKPTADASLNPSLALKKSLSALHEVDPRTVDAAYAWDQITKTLAFLMRYMAEMTDEEFSSCKDRFVESHTQWANNPDVVSGLVSEWGNQLRSIYRDLFQSSPRLSGQDPESGVDQLEEASVEVVGRSKSRSSPTFIRRTIDLLTAHLLEIGRQGGQVFSDMFGTLSILVDVPEELVSCTVKKGRPEQRAQLLSSLDELLWAIGQSSPRLLIDRLADIEPGKAPVDAVRRMEKMLLNCERLSSVVDLQMRLFLLELFGAEVERYCRREGMRTMSHPEIEGLTLCLSSKEKSPLDLLLEESMIMDDLDVACAAHCKEYVDDPSQRMWVLFTLRWYLRKFIEKQRKTSWKAYKEWNVIVASLPNGSLSPFLSRSASRMLDPNEVYSGRLIEQYEDLWSGRLSASDPDVVIGETVAYFKALFEKVGGRAQKLQCEFQNLWPSYELGVQTLEGHIGAMLGYNRLARLDKKVPIRDGFPLLQCQEMRASGEDVQEHFFKPWIQKMLVGGEVGLAKALASTFAPGNLVLENRFLHELRLLVEEEEEESAPLSVVARSLPPVVAESPKLPSPSTKGPRTPKSHHHQRTRRGGSPLVPPSPKREEAASPVVQASPLRIDRPVVSKSPEISPLVVERLVEEFREFSLDKVPRLDEDATPPLTPLPKEILSPVPFDREICSITFSDVERCMQQRLGRIAGRVQEWKSEYFSAPPEGQRDQYDRHTYPFKLSRLIREFGEKEPWASSTHGRMNEHYVCIGMMERYGRRLPSLFGVFSEAFSTGPERELYHHDILDRGQEDLRERYRSYKTFFDLDIRSTPKVSTPFQKGLYERIIQTGSFFSSLEGVPSQICCNERFSVQIADMTLRVDDRMFGNAYTLALRVRPVVV